MAGIFAILGGAEFSKELYYRLTLAPDLKPALSQLTPEAVIRHCGPPDGTAVHSFVFRELSYQRCGTTISFIHTGIADKDWVFSSFHEWFGRSKSRKDPRQVLSLMTCLDPGAATSANWSQAHE